MLWYLIVLILLGLLALTERGHTRTAGAVAAAILAAMAGLRYETGFDWLEYEYLFTFTAPLGITNTYLGVGTVDVEPGYELAMSVFKTFGLGFQTFLFAIAVVNFIAIYQLCRRYTCHIALVLIWYYGFVFISGQMSTIRQCLSISFILWALLLRERKRPIAALLVGMLSVTFHTFSIIFVPFIFLTRRTPGWQIVALACFPGLVLNLAGFSVFELVVQLATPIFGGGLVGDKLSLYGEASGAALSPFTLILMAWHVFFLRTNERDLQPGREDYYFRNFSAWIAILNLFAHTYVADFPIIWNRVMLVSFFVEAIVLAMLYARELAEPMFRTLVVFTASIGAAVSLVYVLSHSQGLAFKPYQSMVVVWFRGHYGDGRARYEVVRSEIDSAARESRMGQ